MSATYDLGEVYVGDSLAQMIADAASPLDWIVERMVSRGFLTILAGQTGVAKSLLAKLLADAHGLGADLDGGFAVSKGRAIYLDAENGPRIVGGRLGDIRRGANPDLIYVDAGGKLDLGDPECLAAIAAMIAEHEATLVVIDTLSMASGGANENDNGVMGQLVGAVRQLARDADVGILMLHHTDKRGSEYRGASSIMGQTDLGFQMEATERGTRPGRAWRLFCVKNRLEEEIPLRAARIPKVKGRTYLESVSTNPDEEREHALFADLVALEDEIRDGGVRWPKAKLAERLGLSPRSAMIERLWLRAQHDLGWNAEKGHGGGIFPPESQNAPLENT
jgi:hypothetical protein